MRVLLKIYKSNRWNCILCYISSALVSMILFLFEGIRNMILGTMTEQEQMRSSLGIAVQTYIYVLLFVGMLLILYTISHYSRMRLRDYGIFMALGCEKRKVIYMIIAEYGLICLTSYVIGCIAGTLVLLFIRAIFLYEGISVILDLSVIVGLVLVTLRYLFFIFAAAVMLNLISLQRHSPAVLLKYREKKGRLPSVGISIVGAVSGILCVISAMLLIGWKPVTYKKMKYGIILALCGIYLCFTYLCGLVLYLLKKRERWYDNHLLTIKNLYYRYSESKNMILITFLINFFVLIFVNTNIVEYGNTSSDHWWKYPFDYVWMVKEEQVERIRYAAQDAAEDMSVYSCALPKDVDGTEYIAISVSDYERLAGKSIQLKHKEILAILQKATDDAEVMFQSDRVYLECGGSTELFRVKAETKEVLFIAQQPEMIRILVMSDEDYASIGMAQDERRVIVTQNAAEHDEALEERLNAAASSDEGLFYSREVCMLRDRQEDSVTLIFYICMGIFLAISNMTVLAVKVWSEVPLLSSKYGFLKMLGMDTGKVKNHIRGELSVYLKVPFWLSVAFGIIMLFYLLHGVDRMLIIQVIGLFSVMVLLEFSYIIGIRNYGYRLIAKRIEHKGREKYGCN